MSPQSPSSVVRTPWQIQRAVVFALFVRELKTRFGGRWLGVFWVLIEPVAHVTFFAIIFGLTNAATISGIEYPIFLVIALVPFLLWKSLILRLMEAIDANQGLFAYRQVKPMDTLLSRFMLEVGLYGVVFAMTLVVIGWLGYQFVPAHTLQLLLLFALIVLSGFALGVIFAVATDEFPQARTFVRIAAFPIYMISGVMFPLQVVPNEYLPLITWNPALHMVELVRSYFFVGYRPIDEVSERFVAMFTLIALAVAISLYRVRRNRLVAL